MKFWKPKIKPFKGKNPKGSFLKLENQKGEPVYIKAPTETDELNPEEWKDLETLEPGAYFVKLFGNFPLYGYDPFFSCFNKNGFLTRDSFICCLSLPERLSKKEFLSQAWNEYKEQIKKDHFNGKVKAKAVKVYNALFYYVCGRKEEA